ncbi:MULTISPECIES: hypothetical protein [unclassified Mesorhizobium]|uniref:hypothetical protein n=2 Tax=unclassified Mesorhizobium TaxID=325217 RepID=UPI000FCBAF7F|nr:MULTISPECIES: hypothetical protein [unclassified Mesorhizobium]TGV23628.1 hypothetical protein EN786_25055 [Mesorhizobium sp. M4B.F.Ca.ET.143.01.1.1]
MSVCETEHWVLDCGSGGCALWEGEAGEVLFWKCYPTVVSASQVVSARRKSPGAERLVLDPSQKMTLCYSDLDKSQIAEAFRELTGRSVVASQTGDAGVRTLCQTGTFNELLQASGLVLQK